jgi:hypothetical protein
VILPGSDKPLLQRSARAFFLLVCNGIGLTKHFFPDSGNMGQQFLSFFSKRHAGQQTGPAALVWAAAA